MDANALRNGTSLKTIGGVVYQDRGDGVLMPVGKVRQQPQQVPAVRNALNPLDESIRYYLGPTGIPDRLAQLNALMNPVEAIGGSVEASNRMMAPETSGWGRVEAAGDMLSNIAGVVAPVVAGARVGMPAAQALEESLIGFSTGPTANAARDFVTDEDGALKVWTGGSGDPAAAASDRGAWFAETPDLAKEYAGQAGRVLSAEIDPQNPIMFRHAEQRRTIGDVISTALEGAGGNADLEAARPIVDRLIQRYGTEPRALFEYWNNDKDVADLFRALGYDAISAAEKSDMKAATWAALNPSIIQLTPDVQVAR